MATLRPACVLFVAMTVLTGGVYPVVVTVLAQVFFPRQANGSRIVRDGRLVGSSLIGQSFDDPRYFWGRPSATTPAPYNGGSSNASNFGPSNADLVKVVRERVEKVRQANAVPSADVPVDLVTSSASGLDPEISPAAALYQVERVAHARRMNADVVRHLVAVHTAGRTLGVLGEPRVNVLELNLALDALSERSR